MEHGECPESFIYLWQWYIEVKGSEKLTYTELKNWSELTCVNVEPFEVEILKTLDRIYWKAYNDRYCQT